MHSRPEPEYGRRDMVGRASRTGLIAGVAALLWLIAAGSAHAAPSSLPAFEPSRYHAVITATDAAGNTGKPVTLAFRIVRR